MLPLLASRDELEPAALEAEVQRRGRAVWTEIQAELPGLAQPDYWQDRLLALIMRDPAFKFDVFRFVDVLPALDTTAEMAAHIRAYLLPHGHELPRALAVALEASAKGLTAPLAARLIRRQTAALAERFIVGRDAASAVPVLRRLHAAGLGFTADLLGEAVLSAAESDVYRDRYLDLIDRLADAVPAWPAQPLLDADDRGPLPRAQVSLKVSAFAPWLDPADTEGAVARLRARLLPVLCRARERGVFVTFDLEQWELRGLILRTFHDLLLAPELRDWPHVGIALQAYLHSAAADLEQLLALARKRDTPFSVRLVKGAYWDYETAHARQTGLPCPVLGEKAATDRNFEHLSVTLFRHAEWLHPAIASHNLRSLVHALVVAERLRVAPATWELQMLYGMAPAEQRVLARSGQRLRLYAPVGELLPGMAYLVRRLLENTSNVGFIRLGFHEHRDLAEILAPPAPRPAVAMPVHSAPADPLSRPFSNCPPSDFCQPAARGAFHEALGAWRAALPLTVPLHVAGETIFPPQPRLRRAPGNFDLVVARVAQGTLPLADRAVAAALAAWPAWRDRPLVERARLLDALADRLAADRMRLAAWQCFEVGKPWREADADVAEAIDFCRYYARQALVELAPRHPNHLPGEVNQHLCVGRGPAVVIAPWNFPLALLTGMTTAALVAGNPVILKPAATASGAGWLLYQHLLAAGFPPDVVQFLLGPGETVGHFLVAHPGVALVAFTGSRAVGLELQQVAAVRHAGQPQLKRVLCELGGKNAIIVDRDADLDEAVAGVMQSAFGYAGQKCSACSRVLLVGAVATPFLRRLAAACASLPVGLPENPATRLGPVIDGPAYERLRGIGPGPGAELIFRGAPPTLNGYYLAPLILRVTDPDHPLMQDELFGPILTVMQVRDLDEALAVAARSEYALTGAVYSRLPEHLARAAARFRVGNLYLNRPCTGALVGRQPFGGFGLSGTGVQAGGPGYLPLFVDHRCVCENTMRRGFAAELELAAAG